VKVLGKKVMFAWQLANDITAQHQCASTTRTGPKQNKNYEAHKDAAAHKYIDTPYYLETKVVHVGFKIIIFWQGVSR
jgi:hypothetical protein